MKFIIQIVTVLVVVQSVISSQVPPGGPPLVGSQQQTAEHTTSEQEGRVFQQPAYGYSQQRDPNYLSAEQEAQNKHQFQLQQQQQYQYMLQQQQLQQQQQQQRPYGQYPPSQGYPPASRQPEQGPGLLSRVKNGLLAVGSQLVDSLGSSGSYDGAPVTGPVLGQGYYGSREYAPGRNQPLPSSPQRNYQEQQGSTGSVAGAAGTVDNSVGGLYPPLPNTYSSSSAQSHNNANTNAHNGLFGRIKNLFGSDDAPLPVYRPILPNAVLPGSRSVPPYSAQPLPQSPPYGPYAAATSGIATSGVANPFDEYAEPGLPPYPTAAAGTTADRISTGVRDSPYADSPGNMAAEPAAAPPSLISPEPQVFTHEGSIVMIARPREFYRKKALFTGHSDQLQVFSDFEHVFTQFTTANGERTLSSAELLESSGAVQEKAVQQLNALSEEFESSGDNWEHGAFEAVSAKCQGVLSKDGGLHIGTVPQVTRALQSKLGLRPGWTDALHSLAGQGVPTYLFSSGYGDVVAQVLLQNMQTDSGAPPTLPQNLRVISNFFRTAPDGTVKAFSQPIVHERNKNATTAAAHMGMEVLNRPYAIVLGSHEDDVQMAQGVQGLEEQLSIGYLELSEDLSQRLPVYLNTFDAVIIGDGNFEFIRSTVDDILQLSTGNKGATSGAFGFGASLGSTLGSSLGFGGVNLGHVASVRQGLKNRLGQLLNSGTSQPQAGPGQSLPLFQSQAPLYPPPMQLPGSAGQQQQFQPPSPPSSSSSAGYPYYQPQPQPQRQQHTNPYSDQGVPSFGGEVNSYNYGSSGSSGGGGGGSGDQKLYQEQQ